VRLARRAFMAALSRNLNKSTIRAPDSVYQRAANSNRIHSGGSSDSRSPRFLAKNWPD
jgi:hypothetical protein